MTAQTLSAERPEHARLLALPVIVGATLVLVPLGRRLAEAPPAALVENAYVNSLVLYQLVTLALTAVVLLILFVLGPRHFRRFFHIGQLGAPVEPVRALGINTEGNETWRHVGRNFAVIITVVTLVYMVFAVRSVGLSADGTRYLWIVPLLAASNAFVEEMITRFGIVVSLEGLVSRPLVLLASAALFGGVHYFGTPGGLIGVAMAGFLGWLLAKSIVETRGVFWAWFIHFLQDVIIISGLILTAA
jgi:hypothetical protein